ncbi:hypothetical protein SAMN04487770_10758 [Butyrivibrio sp. ob235]|uniref:hypothetical protein n=1 Tax=Butyrivibrio sp. ob235 TaxID=1761780 RepID=UPI0008BA4D09|nr:hypothetical protein [Butyrivibrio sp. ob235]SEL20673.1 hypothetical protein SAMN04487770_10758 [Butyrivibrio sp. ob235]
MEKRLVAATLGLVFVLSACGQTGGTEVGTSQPAETTAQETEVAETTEEPEEAEASEETEAADEESSEEGEKDENSEVITDNVITADLFEVTIPDEFSGIFEAEVSEGRVDIYHKQTREEGFPGLIFSIWARETPSEYAGGPYMKKGELFDKDGASYDVVKGEATEIQWDYNKDMPEDFRKLYDAAEDIIKNITATNGGTFSYGAGMKGKDLYAYTLSDFIDALNEGADANKLEEMGYAPDYYAIMQAEGEDGLSKIGFAYKDVNDDGIDELFIGDIESGAIYDVFTMVDKEATHVVSGGARDRYYVYDNSFISNEYSGGAEESGVTLYALMNNDTDMVCQYGYKYDGYEDEEKPWFATYDMEEWTPISEEEYDEAMKNYEDQKESDVELKPLSDIAPVDFSKVDMSQYATFTELVDSLKAGMGYANVTIDGTDALLVASGCYKWDDTDAAIDSSIFIYDENGAVKYLGSVTSQGTANPLAMADGKLITAGHHFVTKNTIKDGKLAVAEEASETFDTDGNATYYVGEDKVDDDTELQRMFDEAMNAEIINFQPVAE